MFARTGECYAPDASPAPPFHTTGTQRQVPHSLAGVGAGPCVPRGLPKEGRASVKPHCPFDACWRLSVGGSSVKINPCIDMSFPVAPTLQARVGAFSFLLDVYRKAHPQAKMDQSPPCCDRLSLISTVCQEEKHEGHVVIRFFFPETHDIRRIDIQSMTVDSPSWASPVQAHNVLRKVPIVP